jgi:hypothetical protein
VIPFSNLDTHKTETAITRANVVAGGFANYIIPWLSPKIYVMPGGEPLSFLFFS